MAKRKSILQISNTEALNFFLLGDKYCSIELPSYFDFTSVLDGLNQELAKYQNLSDLISNPRDHKGINYILYCNKDGKYAWRPLQLIHPVFYVHLAHVITQSDNWNFICDRFKIFAKNKQIVCTSIPVLSLTKQKDKAEQINQWVDEFTRQSLSLSLEFKLLIQTDITDCYSSMDTHSIVWSLHEKEVAQTQEGRNNKNLIGNKIDNIIQDMSGGQTNGIPQGSVLMDFIAEMVLGYADLQLSERLKLDSNVKKYYILRYRDDYRIFANDSQTSNLIIKYLTEVLLELGLKLNSAKTKEHHNLISGSIKDDKLSWLEKNISNSFLLNRLLLIHKHTREYPNSGSIQMALSNFSALIENKKIDNDIVQPLVGIIMDVAYHNPRVIPVCVVILDTLLRKRNRKTRKSIIGKIIKKFDDLPNTEYLNIWLQRMAYPYENTRNYNSVICRSVLNKNDKIWNTDFISCESLKNLLEKNRIIDEKELATIHHEDRKLSYKDIKLFLGSLNYE
ncbi:MAG: RNA-directed DNA polymerase [Planctomycetaceae bacterium]|jgi:hypothetical protein|nr:RNA-directed DNA polymerase [Planctomycetaceae bacterium]